LQHQVDQDWMSAMRCGDFARAWQINDSSLRSHLDDAVSKHSGPRHLQRIWRGEALHGQRVLVRCYHGLGDTIQFARFLPALRNIARDVTVWCQPGLVGLIDHASLADRVLPLHDGAADVTFDVDIEVMELAHALRADAALISSSVPYLSATSVAPRPGVRQPDVFTVGLVWEAGEWDARRSVPPNLLEALTRLDAVRLVSLQRGPAAAKAGCIPAQDLSVEDIGGLAATIAALDLVLTVDTMVAHLAGALGAPVWTMLHHDCDWRWPASGRDTIWYPSMRLYHQSQPADWSSVIDTVRDDLERLVGRRKEDNHDA
jgi:hypothetical protein